MFFQKSFFPTKQAKIMAMGIPLICNAGVSDTNELVERYHTGWLVKDSTEASLASFSIDFPDFDRERTMQGAREYFGLENGADSYFRIYDQFVG